MSDASNWPEWTDEGFWELGPEAADALWASENLNTEWDFDGATPDEVLDREAAEAEALDRLEIGLLF